jgi:tRNA pseudouridine55 synthase
VYSARVPDGLLIVDKPGGMTSHDVVAAARKRLRTREVGHTGTLDPMATGVLPLVVGEGTKLTPYLAADDKEYEGELELGVQTNTLDAEGEVTARAPWEHVTEAALREAFARLTGELQQVPPVYSALKRDGRRLHELARAGEQVEVAPRPVRVDRFDLTAFTPPRARFVVACSKGTYVRALARDAGTALGCGAMLTALRRTRAGRFTLADAVPLAAVGPDTPLISLAKAIPHLREVVLTPEQLEHVSHGRPFPFPAEHADPLRLMTPGGDLAALAVVREGRIAYLRVFNYKLTQTPP